MDNTWVFLFFLFLALIIHLTNGAADILNTSQPLRDGGAIVSAGGVFAMGFFSPGSSRNRYLGIWYNKISPTTVVWVANRQTPLYDASGTLKITNEGLLVLVNSNNSIIWSSKSSVTARNPVAQLLNSGNLVIRNWDDDNLQNLLWQSFDYPGDTLLPGMKLGRNLKTGLDQHLSSWEGPDDPSRGDYTFGLDPRGYPELFLRRGELLIFRTGILNGISFRRSYGLMLNQEGTYYNCRFLNDSSLSRLVIGKSGDIHRFSWIDSTTRWLVDLIAQEDPCDFYGFCGPNGICQIPDSQPCSCLARFVQKVPKAWDRRDFTSGCIRKGPLNCTGDRFEIYYNIKMPAAHESWFSGNMKLKECENMCMKNCSCTAYTNPETEERGSGCVLWFGELINMRTSREYGQPIYIRVAASDLVDGEAENNRKPGMKKKRMVAVAVGSMTSAGVALGVLAFVLCIWRKKQQRDGEMKDDLDLPLFDLGTIACATNNFSVTNELGKGGYGPVYKGILRDGQEIAVKRLSKNSRQGNDEFKNEVMHIAKLQHRNLVKLLGCCIQEDEKMLVYEYLPNRSLDFFIFDQTQSEQLDWSKRYHIIDGIARGLLYLHQDSRRRIIHRDLKASNILLDFEMNPKISDFGLARSFAGNETEVNTIKVAGTFGYISPEYAIEGLYSVKSDVFSFGVMVLEIVSGKRNRGYSHPGHHLNLLGHAWRLFKEGRYQELIASSLLESCNSLEVLRSIHVGLLCVQNKPKDRPSMSAVVVMLASESELPQPKQPGFFTERDLEEETDGSSTHQELCSAKECTITLLEGR